MPNARHFFAIDLPTSLQSQLVSWRAENFAADIGQPVAAANFQLVLAWLGETSPQQLTHLQRRATHIVQSSFRLQLDDLGYWPNAGQIWLGSRPAPHGLLQLGALLRSQAAHQGCQQPAQPFFPYISLYRQVSHTPQLPKRQFSWQLEVEAFQLFAQHYHQGRWIRSILDHYPLRTTQSDAL